MMTRLLRRLMNAEIMGVALCIFALYVFVFGISSSLRNTDTSSFFWICLIAATLSFGLGRIGWNWIQVSAGMAALGSLIVWILGARLTQPLLDLLNAIFSLLPQLIPSIQDGAAIDTTHVLASWTVILESSSALRIRLQTWMIGFDRSVTINDALVRNMAWTLILWLFSAWMGWFANKRNAAASLLPAMALLAMVTSYSEYRIDSLWMMVVTLLFLMGVWNYRNHTLQWLKKRMDFSDSIRIDNGQAVIFLTIAFGAFAFLTPSVSWREVLDYLRERQEKNEAAEMLGIQEPRGSTRPTSYQEPSLPRDHLLSGGFANSEKIVMTIHTGELPPLAGSSLPIEAPRYYWRSTVYDRYVGTGWVTSAAFSQNISSNTPLIPGLLGGYRLVHMDVDMVEPEGRLYWSGVLFSADIPFTASWRVRPPSDLFADQSALLQADMFAATTTATNYQVDTYVPVPSVSALLSASAEYPEEIRLRYLALPLSVPDRVRDLAQDITRGLNTPYERARAIEVYLRTNYPYTLDVPPPLDGQDVADHFLFEVGKGYCDYYATAMVVLARSSGLPSRFVSGYSPGSYDAPNAQYVIRELNAHSWVEVYFPEIGWVEFEPTASLPEIERTDVVSPVSTDQTVEETASQMLTRFRMERILLWSSPAIMFLLGIILYFAVIERWLVLRLSPEAAIDHIYQRFYRSGRPFAGKWVHAETSSEFLQKFLSGIGSVQHHAWLKKLSLNIRENAIDLTELYHESLFVDNQTDKQDAIVAWKLWKHLRRRLVHIKLLLRFTNTHNILKSNVS